MKRIERNRKNKISKVFTYLVITYVVLVLFGVGMSLLQEKTGPVQDRYDYIENLLDKMEGEQQ